MPKHILTYLFSLLLLLSFGTVQADDVDSSATYRIDSSTVDVRSFSEEKLTAYQNDPDFTFGRIRTRMELSFWQKLRYEIWRFFAKKRGDSDMSIMEMILWVLAVAVLTVILLIVFKVIKLDVRTLFSKRAKDIGPQIEDLTDNIEKLDFDQLIQQARSDKNYRRGVRLLYMETLKELTRTGWIHWRINKTNQDYQNELRGTDLQYAFDQLTLRFEYVWYGDFPIDSAGYDEMEQVFRNFQTQLKPKR
ncbi:MAG: DUF4129 domain-containing protein [Bacteroidota bacterium]